MPFLQMNQKAPRNVHIYVTIRFLKHTMLILLSVIQIFIEKGHKRTKNDLKFWTFHCQRELEIKKCMMPTFQPKNTRNQFNFVQKMCISRYWIIDFLSRNHYKLISDSETPLTKRLLWNPFFSLINYLFWKQTSVCSEWDVNLIMYH